MPRPPRSPHGAQWCNQGTGMPPSSPPRPQRQVPAVGEGGEEARPPRSFNGSLFCPQWLELGRVIIIIKSYRSASGWVSIAWGVFDFQSLWQGRWCINGVCCSPQPVLWKSGSHPAPYFLQKMPVSSSVPRHVRAGSCTRRPRHRVSPAFTGSDKP